MFTVLLHALYEYAVCAIFLGAVATGGFFLGRALRIRKNSKA